MSAGDRFYLLKFQDRPVFWGDIGSNIRIQGLVVGGNGLQAILYLPGLDSIPGIKSYTLTDEEWSDFIHFSDDPQILVGSTKIFHRKVRYEISGAIQQKVWAADGFKCVYCQAKMGKAKLTVDHFVPLELGGTNNTENYLTSCASCNKRKGNANPIEWCRDNRCDYDFLVNYLKKRTLP